MDFKAKWKTVSFVYDESCIHIFVRAFRILYESRHKVIANRLLGLTLEDFFKLYWKSRWMSTICTKNWKYLALPFLRLHVVLCWHFGSKFYRNRLLLIGTDKPVRTNQSFLNSKYIKLWSWRKINRLQRFPATSILFIWSGGEKYDIHDDETSLF